MDNEDTSTSMYLSFDAESTMSTACYRTLEAMSDISAFGVDLNNSVLDKTGDDMNSTLEIRENLENMSPLKTVKKIDITENLPLRPLTKNILNSYEALCSTPSKEQLLKTVDVTRGSDATRCIDLGLAFLGADIDKPANFPLPPTSLHNENKENVLPETEQITTSSTSSSVENAASVIEKKIVISVSTCGFITEEESVEEMKILKTMNLDNISVDNVDNFSNICNTDSVRRVVKNSTNTTTEFKKENIDIDDHKAKDMEHVVLIKESLETHNTNTPSEMEISKKQVDKNISVKPKIAVLEKNVRRSVCEPNLKTNKPSRIFNSDSKRRSFLPTSKKSTLSENAEIEIPMLMNKMLKITNASVGSNQCDLLKEKNIAKIPKNLSPLNKRRSIMSSVKTQTLQIPHSSGNKRPFSFTRRMSVVVKTTLNSPACKIARKSSLSGAKSSSSQRRSAIPQKITAADISNVKKSETSSEIAVGNNYDINKNSQANSKKTIDLLQEASTKLASTQSKSINIPAKGLGKAKLSIITDSLAHTNPDNPYTCNVCKEQFRIKSLLDAHKRSHEKPITTLGSTVLNYSNKCKYCDKKFALLKALHIHLLQNCMKIPPSEKRKLQYTDLNHVEKAKLPNVFSHQSGTPTASSSASDIPQYTLKQNIMTLPTSSTKSLKENKDVQKIASTLPTNINRSNVKSNISAQKIKKINAHAGIYKTPNKSIPCHLCKLTFKSILEYTNHNLTTHGIPKADKTGEIFGNKNI